MGQRHNKLKETWDAIYASKKMSVLNNLVKRIYDDPLTKEIEAMISMMANNRREFLCELGSGEGRYVIHFTNKGFEVVGIELSSSALRINKAFEKQRENSSLGLVASDVRKLPLRDDTFDYCLSLGVIEHFPDPHQAVGEMKRVLKPGGLMFIDTPNKGLWSFRRWLSKLVGSWKIGYEVSYSPKDLRKIVEKVDLKALRCYACSLKFMIYMSIACSEGDFTLLKGFLILFRRIMFFVLKFLNFEILNHRFGFYSIIWAQKKK